MTIRQVNTADIKGINGARLGCAVKINGVCITSTAKFPTPLTASDCATNKSKYGITNCKDNDDDYWGGAMKMCNQQGGRLPTDAELTSLAQYLYNDASLTTSYKYDITFDTTKIPEALSGLASTWYHLWSSTSFETGSIYAYYRGFTSSYTGKSNTYRDTSYIKAICIGD